MTDPSISYKRSVNWRITLHLIVIFMDHQLRIHYLAEQLFIDFLLFDVIKTIRYKAEL
jgi:hypothetical protein